MFTMRTLIIIGIFCVLCCASWFFYLQYDTRKFIENLPEISTQHVDKENVAEKNKTPMPLPSKETSQATDTGIPNSNETEQAVPPNVGTNGSTPEPEAKIQYETVEERSLSLEEIHQIIEQAFSFEFTDLDEMYAQLEEALIAHFKDDERIPRFLTLWEKAYAISEALNDLNGKGDAQAFLDLSPEKNITEFAELGIDLFNQNAEQTAHIRESLDKLRSDFSLISIIHAVKPIIEEEIRSGNMTPEEAADILREMTGAEVIVE